MFEAVKRLAFILTTENLVICSRLVELGRADAKRKAAELLEEFGLTEALIDR